MTATVIEAVRVIPMRQVRPYKTGKWKVPMAFGHKVPEYALGQHWIRANVGAGIFQ